MRGIMMVMAVAAVVAAAGPTAVSARAVPHVLPQKYRVVESPAVTATAGLQRHSVVSCPAGTVVWTVARASRRRSATSS